MKSCRIVGMVEARKIETFLMTPRGEVDPRLFARAVGLLFELNGPLE
jgi:hypothetical protein